MIENPIRDSRDPMTKSVKEISSKDFGEIQPVAKRLWMDADFDYLMTGWRRWILIGMVAVFILGGIYYYNHLVHKQCDVLTWAHQVEVTLQRRKDIILNLTNTVVAYASHERDVFEYAADKRNELKSVTPQQLEEFFRQSKSIGDPAKIDGSKLDGFIGSLRAVIENYPQLRASENYQLLMSELMEITNDLANLRKKYNEAVEHYEIYLRSFPQSFYNNFVFYPPYRHFAFMKVDNELAITAPFETGVDQSKE